MELFFHCRRSGLIKGRQLYHNLHEIHERHRLDIQSSKYQNNFLSFSQKNAVKTNLSTTYVYTHIQTIYLTPQHRLLLKKPSIYQEWSWLENTITEINEKYLKPPFKMVIFDMFRQCRATFGNNFQRKLVEIS